MSALLTTITIFVLLGGVLRGLGHSLYGLHIAIVASVSFYAHHFWLGEVQMFDLALLITIFVVHFASINIITYLAYYIDKRASIRGSWRISEQTLQHFALIGGSIGAFIAQKYLRHKTQKSSFKVTFWLITAIQIIFLVILIYYQSR